MAAWNHFEIDIISALSGQLLGAFSQLTSAPLSVTQLGALPLGQGVYQLYHQERLVYVGKADSLRQRLSQHERKIRSRKNITIEDMEFRCLFVHPNWTALAPEKSLINYYKAEAAGQCEWNGTGFGPHDPGRDRETTNKPPDGFDMKYPIREDWPCDWIAAGDYNANQLLQELKAGLPYLLRYQTAHRNRLRDGHPAYNNLTVSVAVDCLPADEMLALIASHLPGWQATRFPGHMILYEEDRSYTHGTIIAAP